MLLLLPVERIGGLMQTVAVSLLGMVLPSISLVRSSLVHSYQSVRVSPREYPHR